MFSNNNLIRKSGIGMIEVVVSVAIIATILVGLIGAFNVYIKIGLSNTEKVQAIFLLDEGIEAVRFIRNADWNNIAGLSTSTDYYITFNAGIWEATTTASSSLSFMRTFRVEDVFRRDSDDVIVASSSVDAKTLDSDTKFIIMKVSSLLFNKEELSTYVTNIF